MSKYVKDMMTEELRSRYADLDSALWVEILGVDGITTNQFRRALHDKQMRLEIVKTSLLRRAVTERPLSRLADRMQGPAALVTGGESTTDIAKIVEEWQPKMQGLRMRGALVEGELIDESSVVNLSKMPTKRDLQAQIAALLLTPGGKIAGAIKAPGARIAACVKTIIEKLEKGEAITKASA